MRVRMGWQIGLTDMGFRRVELLAEAKGLGVHGTQVLGLDFNMVIDI